MPSDLIVLTASNGENRKLAERFVQAAANQNASAELIDLTQFDLPLFTPRVQAAGTGPELVALRDQFTHLGAQVVGRQLLSNHAKPAQDDSINDLVQRLLQMQPLQL